MTNPTANPTPSALPTLNDDEISRHLAPDEDRCFGAMRTTKGHLPLKAMDVQVTLEDLLAQIELSQTFVNTYDEPLEAIYIFPLPDRAAATAFRMEVAGRVIEGELQERGEARQVYDQAIQSGHRASLMEEERPGVFTIRVGNIMPGEQAKIALSLRGPLTYDDGEVTFRFPLVVAERYIPGNPLSGADVGQGVAADTDAVPDASRITPPRLLAGYPNPVGLSLSVDILPSELEPQELRCSLHSVFIEKHESGRLRMWLQPSERLDRDFVLRYRVGRDAVQTSLALFPDTDGSQQGTFQLTVLPPVQQSAVVKAREIVFVLDRSGSMAGWKMVAARRAVAHMVDTLTDRDRFAVYAFDDQLEWVPSFPRLELVDATNRNRHLAIEHLFKIESRGGTQMASPLCEAVDRLKGERDRILVLITDGQVGNEDQILSALSPRLEGVRIFTLGIDHAVNEGFLKRLAALGGGSCDLVESENRLDQVMYKVHRRIGTPFLSSVEVKFDGLQVIEGCTVPSRKQDLFTGVPLVISGRYQGAPEGRAMIEAIDEAGQPYHDIVHGRLSHHPSASVVWARERIRELEDQFVTRVRDRNDIEHLILETSLRYKVLCRFTAFVAVDRIESVNEGGRQHQVVQALESTSGLRGRRVPEGLGAMFAAGDSVAHSAPEILGAIPLEAEPIKDNGNMMSRPRAKKTMLGKKILDKMKGDDRSQAPQEVPKASSPENTRDESGRVMKRYEPQEKAAPDKQPRGKFRKQNSLADKRERKKSPRTKQPISNRSDSTQVQLDRLEATELLAYRRRAKELLERLKQTPDDQRLRMLGVLAVKLGELLEDMDSIGLPPAGYSTLQKIHAKLDSFVKSPSPNDVELDEMWNEALSALETFSELK